MATHTVNISNGIGLFGLAATTKWNAFNWGEALWGEGTEDLATTAKKVLLNNDITPTSQMIKKASKSISNTQAFTSDPSDLYKLTGNGYYYVFRKPTIEAEERVITDWTEL